MYSIGESPGCESLATLTKTGYLLPATDNDDRHLEVNPSTDTAIILFSSGTTGSSKGVQLTHYNFVTIMLLLRLVLVFFYIHLFIYHSNYIYFAIYKIISQPVNDWISLQIQQNGANVSSLHNISTVSKALLNEQRPHQHVDVVK